MQRTAVINVVGLSTRHVGEHTPRIREFAKRNRQARVKPVLPAVTCSAQSTYLTGLMPTDHGAVGNGWYNREMAEHQFWKQSNKIVHGEKIWETLRRGRPGFTCAKLFWWYNMYSSADYTITPRPMYPADGRKVFDVYTQPMGMREEIKADLGEFPFPYFWGPIAGLPSSKWIADSARWVEEKHEPDLSLIYLPHLDYNLQRVGISSTEINKDLGEVDDLVGDLVEYFERRSVGVALLSEYGITDVDRPVHLNRLFREKGWIMIKDELGLEMLDEGASKAFAIADHQVAHVYVNDPSITSEVRALLENTEGVGEVLDNEGKAREGLAHERAGDFVAVADARSWFTYYYWMDDANAPDFARCVDIHRKAGYDPVELFFDPKKSAVKARAIAKLIKKKMGLRMLMDLIPLDATLVKGSHGRIPQNTDDWPILIGDIAGLEEGANIEPTAVHAHLLDYCRRK